MMSQGSPGDNRFALHFGAQPPPPSLQAVPPPVRRRRSFRSAPPPVSTDRRPEPHNRRNRRSRPGRPPVGTTRGVHWTFTISGEQDLLLNHQQAAGLRSSGRAISRSEIVREALKSLQELGGWQELRPLFTMPEPRNPKVAVSSVIEDQDKEWLLRLNADALDDGCRINQSQIIRVALDRSASTTHGPKR